MAPPFRSNRPTSLSQKKQSSTTKLPASLRTELGLEDSNKEYQRKDDEESKRNAKRDRAFYFSQKKRDERDQGRKNGIPQKKTLGRKELRKAQRQEKKISRSNHYHSTTTATTTPTKKDEVNLPKRSIQSNIPASQEPTEKARGKRKADDDDLIEPISNHRSKTQKKHVQENVTTPLQRLLQKQGASASNETEREPKSSKTINTKRVSNKVDLSSLEKQEDDEIAWLEANLGMKNANGKKKKASKLEEDGLDDGLDDFMDDLDKFYPGMYDDDDDDDREEDDFSDDEEDQSLDEDEDEDEEESDEDLSFSEEENLDVEDEEIESEDEEDDSHSDASLSENSLETAEDKVSKDEKVDDSAQSTGKYIPPALRRKMEQDKQSSISMEEQKLQRSIKGLLNRFGENNLELIIGEIESLYRQSSRAHVTNHLTKLVLETIATNENIGDSLVVLYATLISSLHRIVGVEFGAYFIQELIDQFLKQYELANSDKSEVASKQAGNLSALLASLYNLNVIACPLVYDVIRLLLGVKSQTQMSELDVDLLLKFVKLSGAQLRHDDPTSLKSIVQIAQEQQQKQLKNGEIISMRAKFMLESLSDLRNNRSRATTANAGAETLSKMRKFLGNLTKKHTIRTFEPLRVGLEDLRNVEKRGKWWLVGAAWAGYDFSSSKEEENGKDSKDKVSSKKEDSAADHDDANLMNLAKQHGMNTIIRQQIFVTLLNSQDYLDAVQRLLSLTHKKPNQRREIVRVLLHCLTNENAFNPYYVVVGSRIANEDERATQITMQYCLWDYMRKLGEKNVGGQTILSRQEEGMESEDEDEDEFSTFENDSKNQLGTSKEGMTNLARAYGWWIAKGSLTLDCLRAIDFTMIKKGVSFLQSLIVFLLLSIQSSSPVHTLLPVEGSSIQSGLVEKIFIQGTRSNQRLAQGILIFLEQYLTKKDCRSFASKLGLSNEMTSTLLQSRSIALETVRVGARLAVNDDFDD